MDFLNNDPALKQRRRELRQDQTKAEELFWSKVRNKQLNSLKFFRQYSIGPYILDFYCPAMKLAVELDGGQHNVSEQREYDNTRSEYLKAQGINVIRFWNHELLSNMQAVLTKLQWNITPPSPS